MSHLTARRVRRAGNDRPIRLGIRQHLIWQSLDKSALSAIVHSFTRAAIISPSPCPHLFANRGNLEFAPVLVPTCNPLQLIWPQTHCGFRPESKIPLLLCSSWKCYMALPRVALELRPFNPNLLFPFVEILHRTVALPQKHVSFQCALQSSFAKIR